MLKTLLKATNITSDLNLGSKFLNQRQHHPNGYSQMKWMMDYQFNLTNKTTEAFIFYSQVAIVKIIHIKHVCIRYNISDIPSHVYKIRN